MFTPKKPSSSGSGPAGTPLRTPVSHATAEDEALVQTAFRADEEAAAAAEAAVTRAASSSRPSSSSQEAGGQPETSGSSMNRQSSGGPPSRSRRQSRASVGRRSSSAKSRASGSTRDTAGLGDDTRVRKLDEALDRFLGLIDVRATTENFAAAFPNIPIALSEQVRVELINDLKETVKREQTGLIEEYELDAKLRELQQLAVLADAKADQNWDPEDDRLKDVWRPDLDISTILHARAVPAQRERVARLQAELDELEASNEALHQTLTRNMADADDKQSQVDELLSSLTKAVTELQTDPESEQQLLACLQALDAELGPRA
ncbi:unnamed protein product [Parajaminaea phylloscopi]